MWITFYIYNMVITNPLKYFYFVGYHEGMPANELCGRLFGGDAWFWNATELTRSQCDVMIERNFNSWTSYLFTLLYFGGIFVVISLLMARICWIRPLANAIRGRQT